MPEVLAIIPARGGSKGIPGKNLRPLAGKPLLVHTIEHALAAAQVSRVVVSTDDAEIADVARRAGAEVVDRPAEIAGDDAPSEAALRHVLDVLAARERYAPDLVVFLQCTAPIRRPGDVDGAIRKLVESGADSLLSVVPAHCFLWRETDGRAVAVNYDPERRPRRQDRAPEYRENGSIYVFAPRVLRERHNRLGGEIVLYEMDARSAVDIDDPEDLALCEHLLANPTRLGG
jgi:CMP-N,N'-diacetyllegionaminic acid synthase